MRIRFPVTALDYNCHSNERAHGETMTHFSEVTDLGYNTAGRALAVAGLCEPGEVGSLR
jgi:hypothetical protein